MSAPLAGAAAAGAQLAVGELVAAALPGGRSPVSGVGRALIDLVPGPGIDITVALAGSKDKPLLKAALAGGWLAIGAAASRAERRRRGAGVALLAGHGLASGIIAATRPESATAASVAAGGAAGVTGALVLRRLGDRPERDRLGSVCAAASGLTAVAFGLRTGQRRRFERRRTRGALPAPTRPAGEPPPGAELAIPGITPLLTPPDRFYVTDVAVPAPQVDLTGWRLRVHGLVGDELSLTYEQLLAFGLHELDATLVCVHNPVGGGRVGTARWSGVPLSDLLSRAGVRPGAEQVLARSIDGFSAGVPIEAAGGALVAVAMNGEPLRAEHGFPARLLVPGLWGADANTKWLTAIELTTWAAVADYWDRRGWPRRPPNVKPAARIDVPRDRAAIRPGPVTIAGVAWAPPLGIDGVEVSVDGGPWLPAELSEELAPTAWRQWQHRWDASPGAHDVRARAIGRGGIQDGDPRPPYPDGSSGYHTVRLHGTAHAAPGLPIIRRAAAETARRVRLAGMAPPAWSRGRRTA